MNKMILFAIMIMIICTSMALSGCSNGTDTIIGTWKPETLHNNTIYNVVSNGSERTDYYIIYVYPDENIQFFGNGTWVHRLGKYQVISGPTNKISSIFENVSATGTWTNLGNGNYSITINNMNGKKLSDDNKINSTIHIYDNYLYPYNSTGYYNRFIRS